MAGFMCDIVTPEALLASTEVEMAVVPGVEGEMGFLRGHAPIVLADRALPVSDVDAAAVRDELAGIEADLASMAEEEIARTTLHADKAWCEVRLKAVQAA